MKIKTSIRMMAFGAVSSVMMMSTSQVMAQSVSESLFDKYSSTSAGVRDISDGTVFYGGSFSGRIDQNPTDLVGFQSPSVSGGCGGIDMFAGSFSLVSKDEVVQMLRGVAQGVPAYFFNLALSNVCSTCSDLATELEARVAELNQWGKASCETAANALSSAISSSERFEGFAKTAGAVQDSVDGLTDGPMSWLSNAVPTPTSLSQSTGVSEESMAKVVDEKNLLGILIDDIGNFDYPYVLGGNLAERKENLLRLMVTLTGANLTQVVSGMIDVQSLGKHLTVSNLFEGGDELTSVSFYRCNGDLSAVSLNDRCASMAVETFTESQSGFVEVIGFARELDKVMFSEDPNNYGIVERLRKKIDMSPRQVAVINITNVSFLAMAITKGKNPGLYSIMEKEALAIVKESLLRDFTIKTRALLSSLEKKAESKARGANFVNMIDTMRASLNLEIQAYSVKLQNEKKAVEAQTAKQIVTNQVIGPPARI